MKKIDEQILEFLKSCKYDPLRYVMGAFPWMDDPTIQLVPLAPEYKERFPNHEWGPDAWACQFLDRWGEEMKKRKFNGKSAVEPVRFSTVTGHATGKSTLSAWIVKFIMDTRPLSIGTVTANTGDQLRTKTWAEVGKWHKLSVTEHWFDYTASRTEMSLITRSKDLRERWKCFGRTCEPTRSEAFAGQHSASATSFYLFDEASAIDDRFFEVREGGLITGEPMVFDFGNGTRKTGRFYENCMGKFKHRYIVTSVDSRTTYLTDKKKIEQDRQDYKEDSDYFRVRWRGLFPDKAGTQLISTEEVEQAMSRLLTPGRFDADPLIFGVDVARFGSDNSVIYPRIGMDARSWEPRRLKGADSIQVADAVAEYIKEFESIGKKTSAVFVDGGGGYGSGVIDTLRRMNVPVTEVVPQQNAIKKASYRYRIDEMWGALRDAMPKLCLPNRNSRYGEDIYNQLTQREYGITITGQVRLESKEDMRTRGLPSPDDVDALALTFAQPVFGDGVFISGGQSMYVPYKDIQPSEAW